MTSWSNTATPTAAISDKPVRSKTAFAMEREPATTSDAAMRQMRITSSTKAYWGCSNRKVEVKPSSNTAIKPAEIGVGIRSITRPVARRRGELASTTRKITGSKPTCRSRLPLYIPASGKTLEADVKNRNRHKSIGTVSAMKIKPRLSIDFRDSEFVDLGLFNTELLQLVA